MGLKSRSKGKRGERLVANKLKEIWPTAQRGLTQSRGAIQPDVTGTPYWVEVKIGKNPPKPQVAYEQAKKDQGLALESFFNKEQLRVRILVAIKKDREPIRWYLEDIREGILVEVSWDTLKEYK